MAQPERTLDNPVTGERLVFRRTTADTNGEALEYELVFKPQASSCKSTCILTRGSGTR